MLRNLLNLKKAAEQANSALYPIHESEFAEIIVPVEWKPMEPLSKNAKSYRYVKWGTLAALVLLSVLLVVVVTTDILTSAYLSMGYLFFAIINGVRHRGSLFILPKGIILNGKFVSYHQIKHYQTEQIVRWHDLYGLDPKVNNAYKLTITLKRTWFQPQYLVVATAGQLGKITTLLEQNGVVNEAKID
ncbi:hypothetical protein [Bacillus sp. FJAT-29814]|uniref:hypothetical protein n=1 Tax=Bacillus sp. FJAT-29814 TaxID=1729688 RepID=UPI000A8057E3|nr:hypothetical protein [Bacillus sp. FJAT-29814]